MKLSSLLEGMVLLGLHISSSTQSPTNTAIRSPVYPTRKIANVTVIDTPLVRTALEFARNHSSEFVYKHIVRSWLFGTLMIANNATLRESVDLEVHAIAAILHDLGWDQTPGSPFVSHDRRFEVDGAIAARQFLHDHAHNGKDWDDRRVQLVWDSIALHTQQSIFTFKELDVMVTGSGIFMDFVGPQHGVMAEEYQTVVKEFPKDDLTSGVNQTFVWLCQSKPATTYDTFMQPWGDEFVANYSAKGSRVIDILIGDQP
ncbi:hypothetical protein QBC46DRAFT_319072 [Diplogelasinospora grovesii]|uniref:HD domain-containing protein n=1 Tax=Diplogelasinospora grovesii TaxID=303347 RepID=A0AAN6N2R0_9PEZI|nr:hypothetical protein QBC46DRAFT_319072 [Diplogelasinospora grovesii]